MTRLSEKHAAYHRRLLAAGIDPHAPPPEDVDDFRMQLVRRISIYINRWHGCPERLCRRQRACVVPHDRCSNAPPVEHNDQRWSKVQAELVAALKRAVAEVDRER